MVGRRRRRWGWWGRGEPWRMVGLGAARVVGDWWPLTILTLALKWFLLLVTSSLYSLYRSLQ